MVGFGLYGEDRCGTAPVFDSPDIGRDRGEGLLIRRTASAEAKDLAEGSLRDDTEGLCGTDPEEVGLVSLKFCVAGLLAMNMVVWMLTAYVSRSRRA